MATPTLVAGTYTQIATALSGSFSLNCGSGSNRAVFVTFAGNGASNIVSSITVGGVAATLLKFDAASDGFLATYMVLSPPTGTQTVSFTFSAASFYGTIGADSWSNVNQSTPNGTVVTTSSASNGTPSATVSGTTAGNIVRADAWLYVSGWGYTAGQTSLWINVTNSVHMGGAEYTSAGGDKTMTWAGDVTPYIVNAFEVMASVDPPANTVAPSVTGTAQVGETLTTTNGTWDNTPTSYTYLWKHDDDSAAAATATNSTYVCAAGDIGFGMKCEVTASNAGGSAMEPSNTTSDVLPAAPTNSVAPSTTPASGTTTDSYVCSSGTWANTPTSWLWETNKDGAGWVTASTSQNPTLTFAAAGSYATRLTATNAGGSSSPASGTTITVTVAGGSPYSVNGSQFNTRRINGRPV